MKPGGFAARGALPAVLLAALLFSCSRDPQRTPDAAVVVAVVDNIPITLRDAKREILASRGYSPTLEEQVAGREEMSAAVRTLVERSVVLREGARRGISVPYPSLEEEVTRYRADFPPGGMEKALLQMGMSEDEWRERLKRSILYRRSAEAIASALVSATRDEVTEARRKEEEAADRPERIRVRQFLFESEAQAAGARARLQGGTAPAGSGDAAGNGVDLGFFSRERLPPPLPPELFRKKAGEVSGPVVLEGSVSLFRVEEREASRPRTPDAEERRIRESLLSRRREEAFRRWLSQACGNADVKVRAELLEKRNEENR